MKFTFAILLASLSLSVAAEARYSSKRCWDNAKNTMEFNVCASTDYQIAKDKLERATKNVVTVLSAIKEDDYEKAGGRMVLESIKRSATTFETTIQDDCVMESEMIGGTGMSAEVLGCQTKATKKRTSKLNSLAKEYSDTE